MASRNERQIALVPPTPPADQPEAASHRILRTGLLVMTSAVAGGIAMALWNRKVLDRIRQAGEPVAAPPAEPPSESEDEDAAF